MLTKARSLRNKIKELQLILPANMVDLASVTKTWLNETTIHSANIPEFTCFSKNRQNGCGGGVAIICHR